MIVAVCLLYFIVLLLISMYFLDVIQLFCVCVCVLLNDLFHGVTNDLIMLCFSSFRLGFIAI